MKNTLAIFCAAFLAPVGLVSAATIITPNEPTSNVAANANSTLVGLVNGVGLSSTVTTGMDTAAALAVTHATAGPIADSYVTPGTGGGTDYFATGTVPVLTFTLGGTFNDINSIVVWNYAQESGPGVPARNSTRTFTLEFFSDAAATVSLGTATGLTLSQSVGGAPQVAQQVFFAGGADFDGVQAIKMTLTDNYFGTGAGAGGDRVGLAEVRFSQVPEPSIALLGGLGLLGLLRRRR